MGDRSNKHLAVCVRDYLRNTTATRVKFMDALSYQWFYRLDQWREMHDGVLVGGRRVVSLLISFRIDEREIFQIEGKGSLVRVPPCSHACPCHRVMVSLNGK